MLFRAFGYPIQYILVVFVSALVRIHSLIPVSLSGLGIKESSGTYIYSNLTDVNPAIAANVMIIATLRMLLLSSILNPNNALKIYYDLKSAPQAALLRTILTSKYSNKPFSQNRLRALPVKLLLRLMTISIALFGFNLGNMRILEKNLKFNKPKD
jgi:hypothetical protein